MAEDWSAFPDTAEDDPWSDFPDAPSKKRRRRQRSNARRPDQPRPIASSDDVRAVDGDTLKFPDGVVRLWGGDAPELAQQGWARDGTPAPVGQFSRNALADLVTGNTVAPGSPVSVSFGRSVAPVQISDQDLMQQLLREGQGYAAPEFLVNDPERRFDYLQAERLARLNGLGVHDYYVQPPAEHRKNPDYVPLRQDIAQFFDTPTPIAGMSPAAEKQYLDLLNTAKTPDEVVAFVESQGGFKLDPKAVESFIRSRDAARATGGNFNVEGGVTYDHLPMPLTDSGDGASGAGVRGYGQGFIAGALDELGAFPDMLGGTSGRENVWNSDRRLADIWYNNQQQNASILGYDESAHPYAYNSGQVAGALTSGFVIPYGQGARTIPQLARVGGVYGAIEGFMGTNGGLADRAQGAAIGIPVGATLNALGGKGLQLAEPLLKKGWRTVMGESAAEAVPDVASDALDEWADFPDASSSIAMAADAMPSTSTHVRQPDRIDVSGHPQRLDPPLSEAQIAAASSGIAPRDVLPLSSKESGSVEEAVTAQADRTIPAGENAPFPPAKAHDDWPAEVVERAGNVNLDKLESPQDIRRALSQVNNRVGFDAATRGRVTQAETERLASELGMTANDLLSRRKGQALNAEEALAARQILAKSGTELVNLARRIQKLEHPGDVLEAQWSRALMRHAAIQEQVSGATAEAGRALAQFKMLASSRKVPGEVLSSIRDIGGGPKRIKQAADMILDAIEGPPGRFNTTVRKAANPRFSDKLAEFYINNLLSGPQTHVVNAISNTMTALSQFPEQAVAAGIGGARRLAARKEVDRVLAGEVGERLFSLLQGTKEGLQFFARALKTGETSDTFSKIAGNDMRAIAGLKGEIVRLPGRLLNSSDEFFKGVSRRAEINALAYRQAHKEGLRGDKLKQRVAELSANPTDAIEDRALDFARYMTFQRPLTGPGANAQRLVRDYPLLRPVVTFVRTPANLLKFAAERSPFAPALKEWRADIKAGGARRDLAIARSTLGTGIAALAYQWALEGKITGGAPADPAKNRFKRADGWQPYSIRLGDQWVSLSRLDPFAMQLGLAADLATKADGMSDKQLDNYSTLVVTSILSQLADKTWLSGISDLSLALSDWQRYGNAYMRNLGGSFLVPNAVNQTARSMDPTQRVRDTFAQELQSRTPWLSDDLLPQRDIWGRTISRDQFGPDFLSPFRATTNLDDPVNHAMLDAGARFGPPSKQYTSGGVRRDWTPEQYDQLQELAGAAAYQGIAQLISDPAWADMDTATRLKAARKVFEGARKDARATVLGGSRPASRTPDDDPWGDFADDQPQASSAPADDEWSNFPAAPQRDVVGSLEAAIPGIRFTSGFRTPEYQEEMRARGYKPAANSGHLGGSSLDMLPPAGKSLGWLRREVGRIEPDARLLVHDGHLHATFPDWQGAPVFGGASREGITNPAR